MKIEKEMILILEPLSSIDGIVAMLQEMNLVSAVDDAPLPPAITGLVDQAQIVLYQIKALNAALENQKGPDGTILPEILALGKSAFALLNDLKDTLEPSVIEALSSPYNDSEFWERLALQSPGFLLFRWMRDHHPVAYEIMDFLSLWQSGDGKYGIDLDQISQIVNNPPAALLEIITIDQEIDLNPIVTLIQNLVYLFGLAAPRRSTAVIGGQNVEVDDAAPRKPGFLKATLMPPGSSIEGFIDMEFGLEENKLNVALSADGQANLNYDVGDDWNLSTQIRGGDELKFCFSPQNGIEPDPLSHTASAQLAIHGLPTEPWRLMGLKSGPSLTLASCNLEISSTLDVSQQELKIRLGLNGLKLTIFPGDGDAFIAEIIPLNELAVAFDLIVDWSSRSGLSIAGGTALNVTIPLDRSLGPISIDQLRIIIGSGNDGVDAVLTVSGLLDISVLTFVVDDIGIRGSVVPVESGRGALGDLDFELGFKPPNGLGLVIDGAGIVTGGGYLAHDPDKAQYAGVAEIEFLKLGLSAIGVLTTRMPDGSDGWSLFLSVFSEFPPLQIGFGFTLNGVGGLIGINRTLDEDALRDRLLQGALDSIMFPEDPIVNAPMIINDIEAVFPPAQNQFIFGAMLKFGWGTPSLVTADLGVMVELPDPIRIALMGQLEAILPTADLPILELHMDVFGLADLSAQTIALDAVIRDSHIVELLTLSGDMALRADLLDQPTMLLSIGGFSPRFKAPAAFPKLRYMRASVPAGLLVRVDLSCYVAFTSNTFQMGGRVDVWAKFVGFTAEGFVEMDALIQFAPFGFQFHTGFGVTVRAGKITLMGVEVSADLSGPSPWEVFGTATFEILKLKKDIHLEISVGKEERNIAEKYDVAALLAEALSNTGAWSVPEQGELAASIRLRDREAHEAPAVHPAGRVQVTQNIVPLNIQIEVFGGGNVKGASRFSVDEVLIGDTSRAPTQEEFVEDWFAPAQFFKMKDKEKIEAPSFELMDSGLRFGSDEVAGGSTSELDIVYEEIVLDPKLNQRRRADLAKAALAEKQLAKIEKYAGSVKTRTDNPRYKSTAATPTYTVNEPKFIATHLDTGNLAGAITGAQGNTYAETASLVKKHNQASFSSLEQFGIAPREEMERS